MSVTKNKGEPTLVEKIEEIKRQRQKLEQKSAGKAPSDLYAIMKREPAAITKSTDQELEKAKKKRVATTPRHISGAAKVDDNTVATANKEYNRKDFGKY